MDLERIVSEEDMGIMNGEANENDQADGSTCFDIDSDDEGLVGGI